MGEAIIAAIVGALIALGGVLLQAFLGYRFSKSHSLIEARRVIYAELLAASMSEDTYPVFDPSLSIRVDAIESFNEKLRNWRAHRRNLKGIAAQALFLTSGEDLRTKLREFIENNDPDLRLEGIEAQMREEIALK